MRGMEKKHRGRKIADLCQRLTQVWMFLVLVGFWLGAGRVLGWKGQTGYVVQGALDDTAMVIRSALGDSIDSVRVAVVDSAGALRAAIGGDSLSNADSLVVGSYFGSVGESSIALARAISMNADSARVRLLDTTITATSTKKLVGFNLLDPNEMGEYNAQGHLVSSYSKFLTAELNNSMWRDEGILHPVFGFATITDGGDSVEVWDLASGEKRFYATNCANCALATANDLFMLDGKIGVGTSGSIRIMDFMRDMVLTWDPVGFYHYKGTLSDRQAGASWLQIGSTPTIVNSPVNAVSAIRSPFAGLAGVDEFGRQRQYWAVGTNEGVSVASYDEDGELSIYDSKDSTTVYSIAPLPNGSFLFCSPSGWYQIVDEIATINGDDWQPDRKYAQITTPNWGNASGSGPIGGLPYISASGERRHRWYANPQYVSFRHGLIIADEKTEKSEGMVQVIKSDYVSPVLSGDVEAAWSPASTASIGVAFSTAGTPCDFVSTADGPLSHAWRFDGTDDAVNITTVLDSISSSTVGSWYLWTRPDDGHPAGVQAILGFGDSDASELIELHLEPDGKLLGVVEQAGTVKWMLRTNSAMYTDGQADSWTFVAMVQDGVEPKLYVNGEIVAGTFLSAVDKSMYLSGLAGLDNGYVGARQIAGGAVGYFFDGSMTPPVITNHVLTAAEVRAIYKRGKNFIESPTPDTLYSSDALVAIATDPISQKVALAGSDYVSLRDASGAEIDTFHCADCGTLTSVSFVPVPWADSTSVVFGGSGGVRYIGVDPKITDMTNAEWPKWSEFHLGKDNIAIVDSAGHGDFWTKKAARAALANVGLPEQWKDAQDPDSTRLSVGVMAVDDSLSVGGPLTASGVVTGADTVKAGSFYQGSASGANVFMDSVGIGTAHPTLGKVQIENAGATSACYINNDGTNWALEIHSDSHGINLVMDTDVNDTNQLIRLANSAGEVFRVQENGYVGLGATTLSQRLTVAGNIYPSTADSCDLGGVGSEWDSLFVGDVALENNLTPTDSLRVLIDGDTSLVTTPSRVIIPDSLFFSDGTYLTSASLGTATSVASSADAYIQADSDENGTGDVLVKNGADVMAEFSNAGTVMLGSADVVDSSIVLDGSLHLTGNGQIDGALNITGRLTGPVTALDSFVVSSPTADGKTVIKAGSGSYIEQRAANGGTDGLYYYEDDSLRASLAYAQSTGLSYYSYNVDGSGASGYVARIYEGTNDLKLYGGLSTDAKSAPTSGISAGGIVKSVRTGAAPGNSGTTSTAMFEAAEDVGSGVLQIGQGGAGQSYYGWLQATDPSDQSHHHELRLNPNGGEVVTGDTLEATDGVRIVASGNPVLDMQDGGGTALRLEHDSGAGISYLKNADGKLMDWADSDSTATIWGRARVVSDSAAIVLEDSNGVSGSRKWKFQTTDDGIHGKLELWCLYDSGAKRDVLWDAQGPSLFNVRAGLNAYGQTNLYSVTQLSNNHPQLLFTEADATSDSALYGLETNGGQFFLVDYQSLWSDPDTVFTAVPDTGARHSYVSFPSGKVNIGSGAPDDDADLQVTSRLMVRGNDPSFAIHEADQVSASSRWTLDALGGDLLLRARDATGAVLDTAIKFERNAGDIRWATFGRGTEVGIGTVITQPEADLEIQDSNATIKLESAWYDSTTSLTITNQGATGTLELEKYTTPGGVAVGAHALDLVTKNTSGLALATDDTVRMNITQDGAVHFPTHGTHGLAIAYGDSTATVDSSRVWGSLASNGILEIRRPYQSDITEHYIKPGYYVFDYVYGATSSDPYGTMWQVKADTTLYYYLWADSVRISGDNKITLKTSGAKAVLEADGDFTLGSDGSTSGFDFRVMEGASSPYSEMNAGDATFTTSSSRDLKKNIKPLDEEIVSRLIDAYMRFDVCRYNWKSEADTAMVHVGPMAEDFAEVSKVLHGREVDNKRLSGQDMLVANTAIIQNLLRRMEAYEQREKGLEARIDSLERVVAGLSQTRRVLPDSAGHRGLGRGDYRTAPFIPNNASGNR